MKIKTLNRDTVEAMTGYRPFTTFFEDFSIAEAFGADAVRETYNRACTYSKLENTGALPE